MVALRDGETLADYALRVTHERDVARVMVAALDATEAGAWKEAWEQQQAITARLEQEVSRLRALLSGELSHGPLNVQGLQAALILEVGILLSQLGRPDHEVITEGVRWLIAERDRLRALLWMVEWTAPVYGGQMQYCPICRESSQDGHAPDCQLKAELEA
jgi:hypothetical protein